MNDERKINMKQYSFYAMLGRMKYIERWALMRNSSRENISEHSLEVAIIAHALALIGNRRFGKTYEPEHVALLGVYHDCTEIITGDMPTPIKYENPEIQSAYKQLEKEAAYRLLRMLPDDLREDYEPYFIEQQADKEALLLVKAADKISALIKCLEEKNTGNQEFISAEKTTENSIHALDCEEAEVFLVEFLPMYQLTLDELSSNAPDRNS